MAVPPGELGDLLLAVRTESLLFFPEIKQLLSLSEIVFHLEVKAFFVVGFPVGIVRVRSFLDLRMPFNRRVRCPSKIDPCRFLFVGHFSEKDPVPLA